MKREKVGGGDETIVQLYDYVSLCQWKQSKEDKDDSGKSS